MASHSTKWPFSPWPNIRVTSQKIEVWHGLQPCCSLDPAIHKTSTVHNGNFLLRMIRIRCTIEKVIGCSYIMFIILNIGLTWSRIYSVDPIKLQCQELTPLLNPFLFEAQRLWPNAKKCPCFNGEFKLFLNRKHALLNELNCLFITI